MSFEGLLNQTCTIQASTVGHDDVGGIEDDWAALYTDISCRVAQLSSQERLMLGREGETATHRIYLLPTATGVTVRNRAISGGSTFDIVSAEESRGSAAVHHYELVVALRR